MNLHSSSTLEAVFSKFTFCELVDSSGHGLSSAHSIRTLAIHTYYLTALASGGSMISARGEQDKRRRRDVWVPTVGHAAAVVRQKV